MVIRSTGIHLLYKSNVISQCHKYSLVPVLLSVNMHQFLKQLTKRREFFILLYNSILLKKLHGSFSDIYTQECVSSWVLKENYRCKWPCEPPHR